MDLEFHQLDLRYRDLRVSDPVREGRLLSSLAQSGQHVPALVVEGGDGRYVLIDGYRRVELLRRLGRDTVYAMVLSMDEPSALLFAYRLERFGRRSALVEGWGGGAGPFGAVFFPPRGLSLSAGEEANRPAPPVPVSPADALRRDLAA